MRRWEQVYQQRLTLPTSFQCHLSDQTQKTKRSFLRWTSAHFAPCAPLLLTWVCWPGGGGGLPPPLPQTSLSKEPATEARPPAYTKPPPPQRHRQRSSAEKCLSLFNEYTAAADIQNNQFFSVNVEPTGIDLMFERRSNQWLHLP